MFRATVKIAFGFFTTSKNINVNLTTREVIDELQTLVKNNFNVEDDAVVQIVKSDDMPYAELNPELSENAALRTENEMFFYARIIRRFNNIEYMKTDIDRNGTHRICYLKKEDLDLRRDARFYTEAEILPASQILTVSQVSQVQEATPEICVICHENQVLNEQRFTCSHLFCGGCLSEWRVSSTHFNCPLCRR